LISIATVDIAVVKTVIKIKTGKTIRLQI